jgi:hypothetical protein
MDSAGELPESGVSGVEPAEYRRGLGFWLVSSTVSGLLAGPVANVGYIFSWADRGEVGWGVPPLAYRAFPLMGLAVVWFSFTLLTDRALAIPTSVALLWTAVVLTAGGTGWVFVHCFNVPTGGSTALTLASWLLVTLPFPAVAALVYHRAGRRAGLPRPPRDAGAGRFGTLRRHGCPIIAALCVATAAVGLAAEGPASVRYRAAHYIPQTRVPDAEPEAPNGMLLLVNAAGYSPGSYRYALGHVLIPYSSPLDSPMGDFDDLDVIVVPSTNATPCTGIDWWSADGNGPPAPGGAEPPGLYCSKSTGGRWTIGDSPGPDTFLIERYGPYFVALVTTQDADDPVPASQLPALFSTLHVADPSDRAQLNLNEM